MSEAIYRQERFLFRLVDVSSDDVQAIRDIFPALEIEQKKWRDTGNHAVVLPLEVDLDPSKLAFLIRERCIPEANFGVWISVVTERDSDGVNVPAHVLKWCRLLGGGMDFSFTSV